MVFKYSRKDLEKLYDNGEFSRLLEIYSVCTNKDSVESLRKFIEANGYGLPYEEAKRLVTVEIITLLREHNRDEEYKTFIPMKKRNRSTDILTEEDSFKKAFKNEIRSFISDYKDKVSEETYITLKQIYNTKKEEQYLGIYNIQYFVDNLLEEGICFSKKASFTKKIKMVNNFDFMINRISSCNDESQSYGSLIIKIPKAALDSRSVPIYYMKDKSIYLNPEYIVCYVPVKNRKLLSVEFNESMDEVESTVFEGEDRYERRLVIT